MRPQRYARQDPNPGIPFTTTSRRIMLEDFIYGVLAGLVLAYVFAEYLA